MADNNFIRQINAADGVYDISAKYLTDTSEKNHTYADIHGEIQHVYEELLELSHSGIETYVIPVQGGQQTGIYKKIVHSESSTINTTTSELNSLISNVKEYKVGDIILMEETSDGTKVFDRWISAINGDDITLTVLETQVAKHHHTINVSTLTSTALTNVSKITPTSSPMATVGSVVSVVTGATITNNTGDVVSSVDYRTNGSYTFGIITANSSDTDAFKHSHTVKEHSHTVSVPQTVVSENITVISSLSSTTKNIHTHSSNILVAGSILDNNSVTYVTGVATSDLFIKTLTDDSSSNTFETSLTTQVNSSGLVTSTQTSTDTIGDIVKTTSDGNHTHTASVYTGSSVVTSVNIAPVVVTSIDYNGGSVQSNVVTSVVTDNIMVVTSYEDAEKSQFMTKCSVDASGILSFGLGDAVTSAITVTASKNVNVIKTVNSGNQVIATLNISSFTQNTESNNVSLTVAINESGSHNHGFSHTHSIVSHTHDIAGHTHGYIKTVVSEKEHAIKTLSTTSHSIHTHASNIEVASVPSADSFTYVYDGDNATVVKTLTSIDKSYNTSNSTSTTDDIYSKISGNIVFPELSIGYKNFEKKSVIPAVDSGENPITNITFVSSNFVTTVTSGDIKTTPNTGGE